MTTRQIAYLLSALVMSASAPCLAVDVLTWNPHASWSDGESNSPCSAYSAIRPGCLATVTVATVADMSTMKGELQTAITNTTTELKAEINKQFTTVLLERSKEKQEMINSMLQDAEFRAKLIEALKANLQSN